MTADSTALTWDGLCDEGRKASAGIDAGRWIIGELAATIEKEYGANRLADFSKEINRSLKSVYEYRRMAAFYTFSAAAEFSAQYPVIGYTHFRHARRFNTPAEAWAFLMECVENAWTAERAAIEVKKRLAEPIPPRRLLDTVGRLAQVEIMAGRHPRALIVLDEGVDVFALDRCAGLVVRLVVYEEREEARDDALPLQSAG
jgi:hypothetical protein